MLLIQCVDHMLAGCRIFDGPSTNDSKMHETFVVYLRRKVLRGRIRDAVVLCSGSNWFIHVNDELDDNLQICK